MNKFQSCALLLLLTLVDWFTVHCFRLWLCLGRLAWRARWRCAPAPRPACPLGPGPLPAGQSSAGRRQQRATRGAVAGRSAGLCPVHAAGSAEVAPAPAAAALGHCAAAPGPADLHVRAPDRRAGAAGGEAPSRPVARGASCGVWSVASVRTARARAAGIQQPCQQRRSGGPAAGRLQARLQPLSGVRGKPASP